MMVYLAAPWSARRRMIEIAREFEVAGHVITEPWWTSPDTSDPAAAAVRDRDGVLAADVFVLINSQPRGFETSGKAVETGIALAYGKRVILVGACTNIFHVLPDVVVVESIDDAIVHIAALR